MTAWASRISSSVSRFSTPEAPRVSTLMRTPIFSAARCRDSAAIEVWAIPVGQPVTATNVFTSLPPSLTGNDWIGKMHLVHQRLALLQGGKLGSLFGRRSGGGGHDKADHFIQGPPLQ